jgi:carboxylesterase
VSTPDHDSTLHEGEASTVEAAPVDGKVMAGTAGDAAPDDPDGSGDPVDPAGNRALWKRIAIWVAAVLGALVLVVLAMALWPASTSGLGSDPDPTMGYDDAVERFAESTSDEADLVYEPCESVLMDHGERVEIAVVLFHGLTNCPKQFVDFAETLHADGANVLILRAPRHGIANADGSRIGSLANIGGLDAAELRNYADDSVDIAVGLGDEVRVLGLSMGGVLAEWTAQHRDDVDRVVAVAPAMSIPGVPGFLTTGFVNLFDKLPNIDLPGESKLDHAYVGESTEGLVATFLLARSVEESANGRGPAAGDVIVVVNPDDNQVDPDYVTDFAEDWNERSGGVAVVELPAVGLPHDVIDPDQPDGDPEAVYPILFDLLANGS